MWKCKKKQQQQKIAKSVYCINKNGWFKNIRFFYNCYKKYSLGSNFVPCTCAHWKVFFLYTGMKRVYEMSKSAIFKRYSKYFQ